VTYDDPGYADIAACISCGKPLSPPRYGPMARECWDCRAGVPVEPESTLADRFWSKVDKRGPDECWPWSGAGGSGYGRIQEAGKGSHLLSATRVAWEMQHGPVPPGLNVLHKCDNPPCVNPRHLFLGTQADNTNDAIGKGRHVPPRGERNGQSKLTTDQVAEIRRLRAAGLSGKTIAARFGVSQATVSMIHRARRWTTATEER
jgi:hypothetical protein